jgi:hypothetical protein
MVMEVSCNVPAQARDVSQMVSLSAEEDATAEMAADENGKGSIAVPSLRLVSRTAACVLL